MKEITADLFDCMMQKEIDAICITTNGNYTNQGMAVMGAGLALEAKERYPKIQVNLGKYLRLMGVNVPYIIGAVDSKGKFIDVMAENINKKEYKCLIVSFPTKNHFKEDSSLELIKQSCYLIKEMADKYQLKNIALPKVGCGLGKLNWDSVKAEILELLDDRFIIVTQGEKE